MSDKLSELHKENLEEWDGKGVISFCHKPDSVGYSTVGRDNETNYNSTEFWCAMEVLDDLKVPRKEKGSNKEYSIVGRIKWLERKTQITKGNYYYYGKNRNKFKCIEVGETTSKFIDYKKVEHQFYNEDVYRNSWWEKNNCS